MDKVKAFITPTLRPHTLVKQMVAEQERWNDLFSTKLIEVLDRIASLDEGEKQFRAGCISRIVAVEHQAEVLRLELAQKPGTSEELRNLRPRQVWIWACSILALLLGLTALVISFRGFR